MYNLFTKKEKRRGYLQLYPSSSLHVIDLKLIKTKLPHNRSEDEKLFCFSEEPQTQSSHGDC